jgi:hypothetical protein
VTFRRTADIDHTALDMFSLSLDEREELCVSLLQQFGADRIKQNPKRNELVHGCLLPFCHHTDQLAHPTASLNYEKLAYSCFSGGGGGLLWFLGWMNDGASTDEVRRWVNEKVGIGPEGQDLPHLLAFFDSLYTERGIPEPMPRMDARVLEPWRFIHPYLTDDRHVPEESLIRFNVGWDPVLNRIVIPHFWGSNLVGWQSRRIIDDGSERYRSTPSFPRAETIFNYEPKLPAVIVESPMSVISKAHLPVHIEATFGSEVTDDQIRLLGVHPRVILFFDPDDAGYRATPRVADLLMPYTDVWVVENEWAADAADFDDITYMKLVSDAVPWAVWSPPVTLREWD